MQQADHIAIPLLDGRYALAQLARIDGDHALILLSDQVTATSAAVKPLEPRAVLARVVVAPTALEPQQWPAIRYDAVPRIKQYTDLLIAHEYPTEPAIAEALANAIHGLYPWDGFPDPAFFDGFLRKDTPRPATARLSADFAQADQTI